MSAHAEFKMPLTEAEQVAAREAAAARNRAEFPNAAAIHAGFRKLFGDDVRLVYAAENGKELGNKHYGEGAGVLNSEQYLKLGQVKPLTLEKKGRG